MTNDASISNPATITYVISAIDKADYATVVTLIPKATDTLGDRNALFVQSSDLTALGVGVLPYGAFFVPAGVLEDENSIDIVAKLGNDTYAGTISFNPADAVGAEITLTKE